MIVWRPQIAPEGSKGLPLYLAIANALELDIKTGTLPNGTRLPTQRQLATELSVDLTTITRAFREARSRGLIAAVTGKGTFVENLSNPAPSEAVSIDMTMNHPPVTPEVEQFLRSAVADLRQLVESDIPSGYGPHAGTSGDRAIGARWVARRLPDCDAERLVICSGVQGALQLFCLTAVGPGQTLLTEEVTYPGIKSIAAHLGIHLVGVASDAEGMLPDALDRTLRRTKARAVYCTPTLHNPTTATMTGPRRTAIGEVLVRHRALALEDDVYGLLAEDVAPPIASYAPENVFYATSLSKVVAPALRAGYLVAPSSRWFAELEAASRAVIYSVSPFNTLVTRALTVGGHLDEIVQSIRKEARERQILANQILPADFYLSHPDSHHGWLQLPSDWTGAAFTAHTRQNGVVLAANETFEVSKAPAPVAAVRLSLGSAVDQAHLARALEGLRDALSLQPSKAITTG